jgi:hypothetical protein
MLNFFIWGEESGVMRQEKAPDKKGGEDEGKKILE